MPSCAATVLLRSSHSNLSKAVRFHECGTLRYGQAPSGALRYPLKRSASILVQPSTSVSSATTVAIAITASRATDTLYCFNGLQQPQRPSRPQTLEEPQRPSRPQTLEEPQRPQGWMPSFDFRLPIPQLSEKNQKNSEKTLQIAITVLALN